MEEGEIFLNQYDGQGVDELIQLQKTHRIDSLVLAFESALDVRKDKGEKLNDVELTILAVEALEREVNNGGFSQFFYNSSVEYVPIIVFSLKTVGCHEIGSLVQKAIDTLGVNSLDADTIEERMNTEDDELEEAFNDLDEVYLNEIEEVPGYALFDYIKRNRGSIKFA